MALTDLNAKIAALNKAEREPLPEQREHIPPPREHSPPKRERIEDYPPDIHRLLPQSPDAEKGLLGSALLAPDEVIPLAIQEGLTATAFHIPAHACLWQILLDLHENGDPIDIITVTQFARDNRKLDECGGPAVISSLLTFMPTAANASYYVEIMQEKASLRQIFRVCTEYVSRSYTEQENVPELVEGLERAASGIARARYRDPRATILDKRRFNIDNPPAPAVAVYKLGDAIIATNGNLMGVQGKAKHGKSALLGAFIASTMEPDGDCLGLTSQNPNGYAVIHFDTEQSPYDHHLNIKRALHRAGRDRSPDWLRSYYLADVALIERQACLEMEMERAMQAHEGIHSVIIDGVADFCADPNDPEEAFILIDKLHQLAIRFDTVVVCVLHENPGSGEGKTRGHLGSQLERKAETNLRLEKNADGVTVVFSDRARHAHIPKGNGTCFAWNDDAQMHITTGSARDVKLEAKKEELRTFAEEIFRNVKDPFGLSWAATHRKIEHLAKLKPEGARKRFKVMTDLKIITKTKEGKYLLSK